MKLLNTYNIKKCLKVHRCSYCQHEIPKRSSYKKHDFKDGEQFVTYKECEVCTAYLSEDNNHDEMFDHNGETYFTNFMELDSYVEFRKNYDGGNYEKSICNDKR